MKTFVRSIAARASAVVLGASLVVAPLAGCETNPATGQSQLHLISPQEERQLGAEAAPQFVDQYGGDIPDPAVRAYVDEIGRKLVAQIEEGVPEYDWEFHVLDSPVINAFALPGGKVFITRGLMEKMSNEAQLAGVLGHEIGHVTARHVSNRMTQALLFNVGLGLASVAVGVADEDSTFHEVGQYGIPALAVGGNLVMLKFGRDEESQSDSLGIRYMTKAGYNPRGQLQVMEILAAEAGGGGSLEILASHPLPETRIERLEKEIASDYAFTQGNPEYQFFEDRYQREALERMRRLPPASQGSSQAGEGSTLRAMPAEPSGGQIIGRPRR